MKTASSINPLEYTAGVKERFSELIFHFRDDASKVKDSRARTLFKVSAKVLDRLQKAFINYEERIKKLGSNKKPIQLIY